jgi:hypothetical protein
VGRFARLLEEDHTQDERRLGLGMFLQVTGNRRFGGLVALLGYVICERFSTVYQRAAAMWEDRMGG